MDLILWMATTSLIGSPLSLQDAASDPSPLHLHPPRRAQHVSADSKTDIGPIQPVACLMIGKQTILISQTILGRNSGAEDSTQVEYWLSKRSEPGAPWEKPTSLGRNQGSRVLFHPMNGEMFVSRWKNDQLEWCRVDLGRSSLVPLSVFMPKWSIKETAQPDMPFLISDAIAFKNTDGLWLIGFRETWERSDTYIGAYEIFALQSSDEGRTWKMRPSIATVHVDCKKVRERVYDYDFRMFLVKGNAYPLTYNFKEDAWELLIQNEGKWKVRQVPKGARIIGVEIDGHKQFACLEKDRIVPIDQAKLSKGEICFVAEMAIPLPPVEAGRRVQFACLGQNCVLLLSQEYGPNWQMLASRNRGKDWAALSDIRADGYVCESDSILVTCAELDSISVLRAVTSRQELPSRAKGEDVGRGCRTASFLFSQEISPRPYVAPRLQGNLLETLGRALDQLSAEDAATRQAAVDELISLGEAAFAPLLDHLKQEKDPDIRARIEEVLQTGTPPFMDSERFRAYFRQPEKKDIPKDK